MTATLPMLWIATLIAGSLLLAGGLAAERLRQRRRGRDAVLRAKYLHILTVALLSERRTPPRFPLLDRPGARAILVETLVETIRATYGPDDELVRRIVAEYGLDRWLLQRIRRSGGYRRARYLAQLAHLPVAPEIAFRVAGHISSRNRYVRFYALLARITADPAEALHAIASYPTPFTATETAEILSVLRRGMLPIAYVPLLESPVENLRRLGVAIVRQFGIEEAEMQLLRIVDTDPSPELAFEALDTLRAMQLPLCRRGIAGRIARLDPSLRKTLLRRMAAGGYAPHVLQRLFGAHERPYYEALVQSYKCTLACR